MSAGAHVLVVTGLAAEARLLGPLGIACVSAPPQTLAAKLEQAADENFAAVASFGLCGGLAPDLKAGALVIASGVVSTDGAPASPLQEGRREAAGGGSSGAGASHPAPARQAAPPLPIAGRMDLPSLDASWICTPQFVARLAAALSELQPPATTGLLAGSDIPLLSAGGKRALHRATGALGIDTEPHVAAAFAAHHNLPFAALRAVCDSAGRDLPPLSWRALLGGAAADANDQRRIVLTRPVLDFNALEPRGKPIALLHRLATGRGVTEAQGVRLRLTGPVPLADQEFATVAENAGLNFSPTVLAIALIQFLALRSGRLIAAVLVTLLAGLVCTAGVGLAMVGELNLISVAFAVLFIGLGVDFGIQVAVRFRAEFFALGQTRPALARAGRAVGFSLTLAAVSLLAGFFSFLPAAFSGVSEFGLIAGVGMIIAYVASLTLLPALVGVLGARREGAPVETAPLAAVDRWIARHRLLVAGLTGLAILAGLPFLLRLPFDSNPMNLRGQTVESVSTFIELSRNPLTAPNKLDLLVPGEADIGPMTERLRALPEVAGVVSLATFLPADQDAKLALIGGARQALGPTLNQVGAASPPSDAETVAALRTASGALAQAPGSTAAPEMDALRQFAQTFAKPAEATPAQREAAQGAVFGTFPQLIGSLRSSLSAQPITRATLPADLVADWIAPGGKARIEVSSAGDSNDNAVLRRFADAVRTVTPDAGGAPVGIIKGGRTILRAFAQAGTYALVVITLILWVALRDVRHVVLALGLLVLAGILTLEAASLIGLPLNFANIIALPLMFGVGVAFHIYYLIPWRAGVTDVLASSLTRAIFFSALTTGTAFGSLWMSGHPGTSSMGELLAISLVFTLFAAFLVVPAFLGAPPRRTDEAA